MVQATINAFVLTAIFWGREMLLPLFYRCLYIKTLIGQRAETGCVLICSFLNEERFLVCDPYLRAYVEFPLGFAALKTMRWKNLCKKAESRLQEDTANLCQQWIWHGMSLLCFPPFCLCVDDVLMYLFSFFVLKYYFFKIFHERFVRHVTPPLPRETGVGPKNK